MAVLLLLLPLCQARQLPLWVYNIYDTSRWEAVGQHDPPYSREEELRVVEVKKKDPPSADEVVGIVITSS